MVDMKKMRGDYSKRQKSGEFWNPDVGDTVFYVCPPCRPKDKWEPTEGLNYVPVTVHYQVGKNNAMVVSLDSESNSIIDHPYVKAFLKKSKKRLTGKCPMREWLESDEPSDDESDGSRPQTKYLWTVVPIKHRSRKGDEWTKLEQIPRPYLAGKTVYDGIMEMFFECGDITESDGAILVRVNKSGKGLKTKYKVDSDIQTLKKPMKLHSALVKKLAEALKEGGDCDLFRLVANMVKGPSEVEALLSGVKLAEDEDEDDMADEDGDEGEDDEEGEDEEPEEDEEGEDEEPEEDEDEEGEDEDEEPEEDEEGEDEDEEPEEDEEGEDEDEEPEEDEEPAKKRKPLKKKPKAADTSDIESDLEALDAELESVGAKSKTKKKVSKKKRKAS